jgi:NADH:ubiquinone reductase (H+-translocating)
MSPNSPTKRNEFKMRSKDAASPKVVIIGAGFGGLSAAKQLAHKPFDVTIIDRHNYHLFQPLLYQVATAGLSPADIASPIRGILHRQKNAKVILAKVSGIDTARREVVAEGRRIAYNEVAASRNERYNNVGRQRSPQHV